MTTEKEQIQGWKEIAAFLGRDERTAKRWEKQRGLPVRRIPGNGRANVYMLVSELEGWLADGVSNGPDPKNTGRGFEIEDEVAASLVVHETKSPEPDIDPRSRTGSEVEEAGHRSNIRGSGSLWLLGSVAAAVLLLLVVRSMMGRHASVIASAKAKPVEGYRSPAVGVDELYLQGVYFYEQRTPASLENARTIFSKVIQRDRADAPAYAGLAETFLLEREYATRSPREAYAEARGVAEQALSLDPSLAEAHAVLGFIQFFSDFNPRGATDHFRAALRSDPNCVLAHHWYGSMLTHQGRYADALKELDTAERLEPRSAAVISSRAYALGLSGRRSEALEILHKIIQTDPGDASPPRILARLSLQPPRDMGQYYEGLESFERVRKDAQAARMIQAEAAVYRAGGEARLWRMILAREQASGHDLKNPSYSMAEAEAQLGHKEEAVVMLEVMARRHDLPLVGMRMNPLFAGLRSDTRFQQMLVDLGLTDT